MSVIKDLQQMLGTGYEVNESGHFIDPTYQHLTIITPFLDYLGDNLTIGVTIDHDQYRFQHFGDPIYNLCLDEHAEPKLQQHVDQFEKIAQYYLINYDAKHYDMVTLWYPIDQIFDPDPFYMYLQAMLDQIHAASDLLQTGGFI